MQVGKLHCKNLSTVWQMNFALFAQQLLFLGFLEERERELERERERVGKRHRQRVRLNYEKRLCILSRALPQTFASIMHTPTQSACGTQLHWRYQRESKREGELCACSKDCSFLPDEQEQFTAWQIRRISCGFQAFRLVCLAWVTCNFDCQLRAPRGGAHTRRGR